MSKNAWILWALLLLIPGIAGLSYYFAQKNALNDRIAAATEAVEENPAADEYLSMYQRWVALTQEEKAENPWGKDPYGGPEIQQRVKDGQADRLTADLQELDKGLKHYPTELAEALYGHRWKTAVSDYRKECEKAEMFLIGSIFLMAGGAVIFAGGLGKILFSLCFCKTRKKDKSEDEEGEDAAAEAPKPAEKKDKPPLTLGRTQPLSDMDKIIVARTEKTEGDSEIEETAESDKTTDKADGDTGGYFQPKKKNPQDTPVPVGGDDSPLTKLPELKASAAALADKPVKDSYFGWAVDPDEDPTLETMMTTEPLTKELTELTEEMSAIREFAAQQQDQVRKLQDGYDWMIVRRFCMRIIRCVDNIEDRIARLDEQADELEMNLQDIRDELIFALESSGVEQFNPDLQMPFKGLEKYAEAVRQRIDTDDESLLGCIAEVARPGYQYLISEDEVKVVRCAQVKLYDAKQS